MAHPLDADTRRFLKRQDRWAHVRLAGWLLTGVWQALQLAGEFAPALDAFGVRVAGRLVGLAGLLLVGLGFERMVVESHRRAGEAR
jgi:hypothetical protein